MAGRVPATNISYDAVQNVITLNKGGNNNGCLMLDYNNLDYYITNFPAEVSHDSRS